MNLSLLVQATDDITDHITYMWQCVIRWGMAEIPIPRTLT